MAVEKVYRDDLSGEFVPEKTVMVFRVGQTKDRPEACERIEIGPGSLNRPISELVTLFWEKRNEPGNPDGDDPGMLMLAEVPGIVSMLGGPPDGDDTAPA